MNSKNQPIVSIVMPVKNAGVYVKECLNSILNQSFDNWELIAINDHSTDDSKEMLVRYAENDARIRTFDNDGQGIIDALRMAYRFSTGNFITRMDADDIMMPNKLQLMSEALNEKGRGHISIGYVEYFSEHGIGDGYRKYAEWLNRLTRQEDNFSEIYKECVVPSPSWMIHRADLDASGAFDAEIYPEDYDLCFRFYQAGYLIAGIPEIIHRWRDYNTRSSRTDEHYADNRFLDLKIHYFLKLDYKASDRLILWGAGKKGKLIAQQLCRKEIPFLWLSNNPKKIGHVINAKEIMSSEEIYFENGDQLIISVANPNEQLEIIERLKNEKVIQYLFC